MLRRDLFLAAPLALAVVGCGGALDTHDRAPSQLVAECMVSSNGSDTVLVAGLTSFGDGERVVLHERDAALTHDAAGEHRLASFASVTASIGGDSTVQTSYGTSIPATVAPTLGLLLDNRPIVWATFTLPTAPTLKVSGEPRVLAWEPSNEGKLVLIAACDDARPPERRHDRLPGEGGTVPIPIDPSTSSIEVTKLESLLFGEASERRTRQPGECTTIHVTAARSTRGPVALGIHASSSCVLEQVRSIVFDRTDARTANPAEEPR
ncbi:MAG: hypothetical protein U0414_12185 [Polyangiaceae bacterium]